MRGSIGTPYSCLSVASRAIPRLDKIFCYQLLLESLEVATVVTVQLVQPRLTLLEFIGELLGACGDVELQS